MPSDKFKAFWTIVIVVLMVYIAIFVPFRIAFIENDTTFLVVLDSIVDFLFAIDIFINFISAIEDPLTGQVIVDHKTIAKQYLTGWFWLDFVACLPLNLIPLGSSDAEGVGEN